MASCVLTAHCGPPGLLLLAEIGASRRVARRNDGRCSALAVRAMAAEEDVEFEKKLEMLKLKSSGTKAELRKARKSSADEFSAPSESSRDSSSILLAPVPLEEPQAERLPVALGFTPYAEKLNGRMAALGLLALLSVELATGGSILEFHDAATVGLQIYFLLGVGAIFVKVQKEKVGVWPK
eukprot:TRINITY_DN621_c0_g1_i1.p1 TRINITY_DN621_c0_g1~~TRINITY_DN621_c0_g1_i1.p1  ORF type:complete len:181 (+),score=25.11 TRINITY_DN621_c0_g1_i1:30-572(+)